MKISTERAYIAVLERRVEMLEERLKVWHGDPHRARHELAALKWAIDIGNERIEDHKKEIETRHERWERK